MLLLLQSDATRYINTWH